MPQTESAINVSNLAARLIAREREAAAAALNLVENAHAASQQKAVQLLHLLESAPAQNNARRIGLTGAPGAGKSTLLDALVRRLRAQIPPQSCGVIAVDPSSARSGGALLGDRARVRAGARDGGVFFRSFAAREMLGGLSQHTRAAVLILGAAFDTVFIESVGVGQSESDIAQLADTLVFVAQPGAGDFLQAMKAGVLEWPDIVAVNKCDGGPAAQQSAAEISAALGMGAGAGAAGTADNWRPPVLCISARDGAGLSELESALAAHNNWLGARGMLAAKRLRGRNHFVRHALMLRYGSYGIAALQNLSGGSGNGLDARLAAAPAAASAARLIETIGAQIESALSKGQ